MMTLDVATPLRYADIFFAATLATPLRHYAAAY